MGQKQHFLLLTRARTLSVRQIFEISNKEAFGVFKDVRRGASVPPLHSGSSPMGLQRLFAHL